MKSSCLISLPLIFINFYAFAKFECKKFHLTIDLLPTKSVTMISNGINSGLSTAVNSINDSKLNTSNNLNYSTGIIYSIKTIELNLKYERIYILQELKVLNNPYKPNLNIRRDYHAVEFGINKNIFHIKKISFDVGISSLAIFDTYKTKKEVRSSILNTDTLSTVFESTINQMSLRGVNFLPRFNLMGKYLLSDKISIILGIYSTMGLTALATDLSILGIRENNTISQVGNFTSINNGTQIGFKAGLKFNFFKK